MDVCDGANANVGQVYEYVRPSQEFLLLKPLVTRLMSSTLICSGKEALITSFFTSSAKTVNKIQSICKFHKLKKNWCI